MAIQCTVCLDLFAKSEFLRQNFFCFTQATDQTYVAKMNQKFGKNSNYIRSTQGDAKSFTIAHYAGHVSQPLFSLQTNKQFLLSFLSLFLGLLINTLYTAVWICVFNIIVSGNMPVTQLYE